jgi:hypothetical protein
VTVITAKQEKTMSKIIEDDDNDVEVTSKAYGPFQFGKIYKDRAHKKKIGWIWMCDCDHCKTKEVAKRLHGRFKTLRAAEQDVEQAIMLAETETPANVTGWN